MTQAKTENNGPNRPKGHNKSHRLAKAGVGLGLGLTAGLLGLSWWARGFINQQLSPLIAQNLSNTLKRPVELGRVERVSPIGLRFGPSALLATPTDADQARVQAIEVGFDLPRLLFSRTLSLDVTLIRPDVYLDQAPNQRWLTPIELPPDQGPITTQIQSVNAQDARLTLVPSPLPANLQAGRLPADTPRVLENVQLRTNWINPSDRDPSRRVQFEGTANAALGGNLALQGEWDLVGDLVTVRTRLQGLSAQALNGFLPQIPVDLLAGQLDGNVGVRWYTPEDPSLDGSVQLRGVTAQVVRVPQRFNNAVGTLRLDGLTAFLEPVQARYGEIPFQARGSLGKSGFNVQGVTAATNVDVLLRTLNVQLPFPTAGQAQSTIALTGTPTQPLLAGEFRSTNAQGRFDRVPIQRFRGRFQLAAPLLSVSDIEAYPTIGGVVRGQGQANLTPDGGLALNFRATGISGEQLVRAYGGNLPVAAGPLNATAQVFGPLGDIQVVTRWQAPSATYPARGEIAVARGVATLRDTVLNVAGGSVNAAGTVVLGSQGSVGRWQGTANLRGIRLERLAPDQRGLLSGTVGANGSLASFRPQDIRGSGNLLFSQGVAVVREPLSAQVAWDGRQVLVREARAPGVRAQGTLGVALEGAAAPAITSLNLNVSTRNYPLSNLGLAASGPVALAGDADFEGRVSGTVTAPQVVGTVGLNGLRLNQFKFQERLNGRIASTPSGVNLNLRGSRDRLVLALDPSLRPRSFELRRGDTLALGRTQGNQLLISLQQLPLAELSAMGGTPSGLPGPVGGQLSGDFAVTLPPRGPLSANNISLLGDVAIVEPSLGPTRGDQFTGRVRYRNGTFSLEDGDLRLPERSRYRISQARFSPGQRQEVSAEIEVVQGEVQDVLRALQIFELPDFGRVLQPRNYARANVLERLFPRGEAEPNVQTFYAQLQRYAEITEVREQQQLVAQDSLIPDLGQLQGSFLGQVKVGGSLRQGLQADFNLTGNNWRWGDNLRLQAITAQGSLRNGVLTLNPLRLANGPSEGVFIGQIGGPNQRGRLQVTNFPVATLRNFFRLPIAVAGGLNAEATLSGSLANPRLEGALELSNGRINRTDIQQADGSFEYNNGRLEFNSRLALTGTEPARLRAVIPYKLPFAQVEPQSDQIEVDLQASNAGLALLNLFSQQVAWISGQGDINLQVRGTLNQPRATGRVTLNGASFRSALLQGSDLTEVTGAVDFVQDRLIVREPVQGQFSDGRVSVVGVLPLSTALGDSDADANTPLTVNLSGIRLSLKGLYSGQVDGDVPITGTALLPRLGGQVTLSNGQVLLPSTDGGSGLTTGEAGGFSPQFNNLRITLGDRLQVALPPLLNFLAVGDITINGDLQDIRPEGRVNLQRGQVNLFATRFTLDRNQPNYAEFNPNQGLDPTLNIRVNSAVAESSSSQLDDLSSGNDPTGGSFGSLRTVQVQAAVTGRASQFNLSLTSSPPRSETEIVALIGGGFVGSLESGNSTLALANFAGSALLNTFQGVVTDALGLSDFRLFPTIIPSEDGDQNLGLAAEAAVDITRGFSVSVLQVLTGGTQPTRFTLRYKLNNEILLRAFTDIQGNSGGSVEYETRF